MSEDPLLASPPLTLTSQIVQTTSRALKRVHESVAEALLGGQDEKDASSAKPQPESRSPGLGTLDSLAAATEAAAKDTGADTGVAAGEKGETLPGRGGLFDAVA